MTPSAPHSTLVSVPQWRSWRLMRTYESYTIVYHHIPSYTIVNRCNGFTILTSKRVRAHQSLRLESRCSSYRWVRKRERSRLRVRLIFILLKNKTKRVLLAYTVPRISSFRFERFAVWTSRLNKPSEQAVVYHPFGSSTCRRTQSTQSKASNPLPRWNQQHAPESNLAEPVCGKSSRFDVYEHHCSGSYLGG